jgi:hypothetical protein
MLMTFSKCATSLHSKLRVVNSSCISGGLMRYRAIPKDCVVSQEALRPVCILHTLL